MPVCKVRGTWLPDKLISDVVDAGFSFGWHLIQNLPLYHFSQTRNETQSSVVRVMKPINIAESSFVFIAKNSNILMSNLHSGHKDF